MTPKFSFYVYFILILFDDTFHETNYHQEIDYEHMETFLKIVKQQSNQIKFHLSKLNIQQMHFEKLDRLIDLVNHNPLQKNLDPE